MKVFPDHSLLLEEFVRVRQMAATFCTGQHGRDTIGTLNPVLGFTETVIALEQTDELRRIFISGEQFPQSAYPDLRPTLKLLGIRNSVLAVNQFQEITVITQLLHLTKEFLKNRSDKYPLLAGILSETTYEPEILKSIDQVMDETGFVRNNASPELAKIRKNLARKRVEANQLYLAVIQKYRKNGWLTDAEESWRSGRRVISVFAEQKRSAKGIIHDISATGKTCYVEPEETIAINTLILEQEEEEKAEIKRILAELTSLLRKYQPLLVLYADHICTFDVIAGKARLALQLDAHLPFIENKPLLDLIDARHPLLYAINKQAGRTTIPFNLKLEGDERILVISGPNAGGKTVCMKTVGLLQMLLQSGFLVTADGKSRFGFFKSILIDIGDSQSLDYELSTYSSRLRNMKVFLEQADERTLFFIDEFGTGTDPALGGALAEAILEELNIRHCYGIITTHYMNLKVLADRTKGIINGSMAFDANRLVPLYRLEVGKPGSSYTFVVASRSGLPQPVINRARKKVKKNSLLLEELLNRMDREKANLQKLLADNRTKQKQLDELISKYEKNVNQQDVRLEQDQERVRQKELRLVNQMEDKFKRFVRDWREAKNKKTVLEKYTQQFGDKKKSLSVRDQQKLEEELKYNASMIKPGSKVHLRNGKVTGIVESIEGTKATVVFGNVRTISDLSNLIYVEEKKPSAKRSEISDQKSGIVDQRPGNGDQKSEISDQ
jgi:DNA mismatch repair protein MutS2